MSCDIASDNVASRLVKSRSPVLRGLSWGCDGASGAVRRRQLLQSQVLRSDAAGPYSPAGDDDDDDNDDADDDYDDYDDYDDDDDDEY